MRFKQLICRQLNGDHLWGDWFEEDGIYMKQCMFCGTKVRPRTLDDVDKLTVRDVEDLSSKTHMPNVDAINEEVKDLSCPNCMSEKLFKVDPEKTMEGLTLMQCEICGERCYKNFKGEN